MQPYVETAIQWLYDTLRCHMRALREWNPPPPPGEWVMLCWDVGHSLVRMQANGIPAQPVIEGVSEKLVAEFGAVADLTPGGIRVMRQFYLDYFERPHLQAILRAISWDCHKIILAHCRDPLQQEFYLDLCRAKALDSEALALALKDRRYEVSAASSKALLVSKGGSRRSSVKGRVSPKA